MIASVCSNVQNNTIKIQNIHWPRVMHGQYIYFWWFAIPYFTPRRLRWICSSVKFNSFFLLIIREENFEKWFQLSKFIVRILFCFDTCLQFVANYPELYSVSNNVSKFIGTRRLFLVPPSIRICLASSIRPCLSIHRGESGRYLFVLKYHFINIQKCIFSIRNLPNQKYQANCR